MSHTSYKVAVSSRNAALTSGQNTHVSTKARSTGRCTYNCSSLNENLKKPLFHCLQINCLSRRNHNTAKPFLNLASLQNLSCNTKVVNTAIRTGSDYRLVYNNRLSNLRNGLSVLW